MVSGVARAGAAPFLYLAVGAAALGLPSSAAAEPTRVAANLPSGMLSYAMARGDSLYLLAQRYFLNPADFRQVQKINRIADPRRVPVARVITIPTSILRGEELTARLVAMRGAVAVTAGSRSLDAVVGMALTSGTALETGENGLLTIEWPNGSRTTLPTRSKVVIRKLRRILLNGAIDYELEVGTGKAETVATPIGEGKGEFRVRTPRAVSAVRGTRFRVGFGGDDSSAEVIEGNVAVGAGAVPTSSVTTGYGARIAAGGAISKEALLPAVEIVEPGKIYVDPVVELALTPVAGARGYHVQISSDSGFVDIVADQMSAEPLARFANLPNGNWFVRATAISGSGLEGLYQSYVVKRRLTGLAASADGDLSAMKFRWSGAGEGKRIYRFQIMREKQESLPVVDEGGLGGDGLELRDLDPGTYFWRVGVRQFQDGEMTEKWLPFEKLILAPQD